jgi:AcrR family transcriptional regulator
MWYRMMQKRKKRGERKRAETAAPMELAARALQAFIAAGTIEVSLDRLAAQVGISKRMLVHYFGDRETLEERAMTLLEERLRAQFAPGTFPKGAPARAVVKALWERTTAPQNRNMLRLIMDLSRRAWNGSARARKFYAEQQGLWVVMLLPVFSSERVVEEFLQMFQGTVLVYLVSGDASAGWRALDAFLGRVA